jgi:ribosomal protein L36
LLPPFGKFRPPCYLRKAISMQSFDVRERPDSYNVTFLEFSFLAILVGGTRNIENTFAIKRSWSRRKPRPPVEPAILLKDWRRPQIEGNRAFLMKVSNSAYDPPFCDDGKPVRRVLVFIKCPRSYRGESMAHPLLNGFHGERIYRGRCER